MARGKRSTSASAPDAPLKAGAHVQAELQRLAEEAESHAFSVRQLIKQRERLLLMISAMGSIGNFANGHGMADVAAAVADTQSQYMQEVYALLLNRGKCEGFFVEVGACDGIETSNTLLLEERFGWKGILAESARHWQDALRVNRKAKIDTRCLSNKTGEQIDFEEVADRTQSTVASHTAEVNKHRVVARYKVDTVSLLDLLREHDAPAVIDFLSIDVEGLQETILTAFPFDKYRFNFICVEHRDEKVEAAIRKLLESVGYKQVFRAASVHDGFYVPSTAGESH